MNLHNKVIVNSQEKETGLWVLGKDNERWKQGSHFWRTQGCSSHFLDFLEEKDAIFEI